MAKKARNTKLLKKVALRIKQLRKEHKITQEVFLYDTGIDIGRIESIRRDISLTTIDRICKYFNISISEFFKGLE